VTAEVDLPVAGQPNGLEVAVSADDAPRLLPVGQAEGAGRIARGSDVGVGAACLHGGLARQAMVPGGRRETAGASPCQRSPVPVRVYHVGASGP